MSNGKLRWCTGFLILAATLSALGMAGDLKIPSLTMPSDTPPELHTKLISALSHKDCHFLDGRFINASTTLHYGGSAASLSGLIKQLASCEAMRVRVSFVRDTAGPCWTVKHNAWANPNDIFIQINTANPALDLRQLEITVLSPSNSPR